MIKLNCPICSSDKIQTSAHPKFKDGIFTHRCMNDDCPKHVKGEYRFFWEGEKYKHDKYPEANLDIIHGVYCPFCKDNYDVYISLHSRFDHDEWGMKCQKCKKYWYVSVIYAKEENNG